MSEAPTIFRKSRPTSITLTSDQHESLRLIAERRLSSVSQTVRELVQAGIDRERREAVNAR